jgi:hypothetical protein
MKNHCSGCHHEWNLHVHCDDLVWRCEGEAFICGCERQYSNERSN